MFGQLNKGRKALVDAMLNVGVGFGRRNGNTTKVFRHRNNVYINKVLIMDRALDQSIMNNKNLVTEALRFWATKTKHEF